MMLPALGNAPTCDPVQRSSLYAAYLAALAQRGAGNTAFRSAARSFLTRWPDPAGWACEPLPVRLSAGTGTRPFLNFLMLAGFLRPGYDYLLERKLRALLRESKYHPIGAQLDQFLAGAAELGYAYGPSKGMASQVAVRVLIQTGRTLGDLTPADFAEFEAAIEQRETSHGRDFKHYRGALFASRAVIYHLGCPAEPAVKRSTLLGWSWERHLTGVPPQLQASLVAYLECAAGTRTRSTVSHMASRLAHFARELTVIDPELTTLAGLDRQRHVEPYLAAVAAARHPHTGAPLSASERRSRVHTLGRMIDDINEWGWREAPGRRLIFPRDAPRLPRPLPRYLPPDADRRLAAALGESGNRLRADALLLARATGLRIGELVDLELDCVHEVPGAGAWLKVPLGKLDTERMVPLDPETVDLVDRITEHRSPGRPMRNTRTGRLSDFLLTHQGRRVFQRRTPRGVDRRRRTGRSRPGHAPPTPPYFRDSPCQFRGFVAITDGHAGSRVGRDESSLRAAVRHHSARRIRTGPHPGQSSTRCDAATSPDPQAVPTVATGRQRLAGSTRRQGPPRRWVLRPRPRAGCLPVCEHLRTLPELSHRHRLPADPGRATGRHHAPGRRRRTPRLDRGSGPSPCPDRPPRPAAQHR